ncbi:MAG: DUF2115 domain-containing protein [Methanoregula sp.]|uniref:DUF2115 domain-containing protein n=1 Tax=Methanoregula sp. TaxID=2052170 RepID=UPI0025E41B11|nr:DUF2115 domain-containing protein [Methanoregula sp.]MCK9630904.1 DUF2115 domain-containing protein [Methanoregula sp.]
MPKKTCIIRLYGMTGTGKTLEHVEADHAEREIREIAERMQSARTKGDLGIIVTHEVQKYSLFDLQIIGGKLNTEIERLPPSYRDAIRPCFREQLFGKHHLLLAMYRSRAFERLTTPIHDRERFDEFCGMVPNGTFAWDDSSERNPYFRNPKNRLFYYLIAAFTMFVMEEPGHPVGMPFPGGFKVEQRGRDYYCLIRDKEKEIFYSICNFCPALQSEEPGTGEHLS